MADTERPADGLDLIGRFCAYLYDSAVLPVVNSARFRQMTAEHRAIVLDATMQTAISVVHDMVAKFQENEIRELPVRMVLDRGDGTMWTRIDELSDDDLKGELFTGAGWLARFAQAPLPDGYRDD
ncbi:MULTISPECIES: hypothetical protein [unclassified Gordonia (in: high G+C Gram-positive bacteria)]|uniref:hypothetical protein n=1 Tax=Gordonia sp. VNQ95 TaxID=3156619 RepID=UPI0032B3B1F8